MNKRCENCPHRTSPPSRELVYTPYPVPTYSDYCELEADMDADDCPHFEAEV